MSDDPLLAADAVATERGHVLVDCRPDAAAYAAGHLAGAVHAQLERDLSAPVTDAKHGGRHPLPSIEALCARLGDWGITPSTHVIAYDDQGGANAAARLWWLLRALGHARVQVVDGGLAALRAAGHVLTAALPTPASAPPYPATHYVWPQADRVDVDAARTDVGRCVLDVRAAPRFRGEAEPIDPIAGHIPGAINVPLSENLGPDGRFKAADALRALYQEALAGRAPTRLIVHCGSGVTACHTLLALERAGLPGAALYVGSWSEWCRNPELLRSP
ncbi:MAG: rhodanese-like domain-containing protein [Polyangiales bacterium]